MTRAIITIGDADKGGWWFSINDVVFEDGFRTEQDAINAATAAVAGSWEIWYDCEARGRRVMIPARNRRRPGVGPPLSSPSARDLIAASLPTDNTPQRGERDITVNSTIRP